ncbi:MAG: hypothetical protein ACYC35_12870 [Pirellulales bacterium]
MTQPESFAPVPAPQPAPKRKRRWLRLVLMAIIFLSGVVIGAGSSVLFVHHRMVQVFQHPDQERERLVAAVRRHLGLSDEQTEKVERIFLKRQAALEAIRRDMHPRIAAELDGLDRDMTAVLDADQAVKWRTRFEFFRHTWFPPPPRAEGPKTDATK